MIPHLHQGKDSSTITLFTNYAHNVEDEKSVIPSHLPQLYIYTLLSRRKPAESFMLFMVLFFTYRL